MKHTLTYLACLLLCCSCARRNDVVVTVENPSHFERNNEMIELPIEVAYAILGYEAAPFVVKDATGSQVPYQITHDRQLIFQASVPASGKATYYIESGTPSTYAPVAVGKHYPERVDDIAWENDRIAFRAYGPALQATGERAFGYDVWAKRVNHPVVDNRYQKELNPEVAARIAELRKTDPSKANELYQSVSYHVDHGDGLDYYSVGPTLGAGTSALLDPSGNIIYPWAYKEYEIHDNGPLRFSFTATYPTFTTEEGDNVYETRYIELDAGSQLNRVEVRYNGLTHQTPVAVGIVLHDRTEHFRFSEEQGYMAYAEPEDPQWGQLFIGAYIPGNFGPSQMSLSYFPEEERRERKAFGHLLAVTPITPEDTFVYYFGAGWNRWGFSTADAWYQYMKRFTEQQQNPLTVKYRINN